MKLPATLSLLALGLSTGIATAAPKVDDLLCKRTETKDGAPIVVVSITGTDTTSATSPDGARAIQSAAATAKGGFAVVDVKSKKARPVHNRDKSYDCDLPLTDTGEANSVRWLGNDVIFAQGWFCEEFDARPYLASAKTGAFLGALKLKKVSPEAIYHFAPLAGSTWAMSVFDHNSGEAAVLTFNSGTGKITATKKVTGADLDKLPACAK